MKTIPLFSALALTLIATSVFADNDPVYLKFNKNTATVTVTVTSLTPALPAEAAFNEVDLTCVIPVPAGFFKRVHPSLPRYADFDDDILPVHVGKLIPALPLEADF